MRREVVVLASSLSLVFAGCMVEGAKESEAASAKGALPPLPAVNLVRTTIEDFTLTFKETVVTAAVGFTNDLYEPTMEVSDTGVIYVTGHTILVDTTGAPVFMSKDDGKTWSQLPFWDTLTMLGDIHGATPPPSDEIFLVAGEKGQLWGVDITLLTFPVNGWCDDGARHCYHNPDAYDVAQAQTARAMVASGMDESCSLLNVNDRPWVDYGDGKLLLVNNAGGGPVQVGIMDVPTLPVGGPGLALAEPFSADWNLCAGEGGGSIPGIPGMRDDHFFAVPQVQSGKLVIVKGYGDVHDVEQVTVFENTNVGGGTINNGHVVFDQDGTMFVGIRNNTAKLNADGVRVPDVGQLHIAVSQDDGATFAERTFVLTAPATSIYLDGNMAGPGALLSWAQRDAESARTDWYAAHLYMGPDGAPMVENVSVVVEAGPPPSAHVQGAAAGPDGRAYIVTFHGNYGPLDGHTPLHVWVQQGGPTLPVVT